MSRREDRERKIAGWLEHLESWQASGEPLCAYARARGIEPWSMYHWRKVLRREGHWSEAPRASGRPGRTAESASARVPVRFARVKLSEPPRRSSLTVRLTLSNARRAEIDLDDAEHLVEVLAALERSA
jgi:hypothetical protein